MAQPSKQTKHITLEGEVIECLPGTKFKVKILLPNGDGHIINAHISGKMRIHYIRLTPGDKVTMEVSPYDLTQGRITYRLKDSRSK